MFKARELMILYSAMCTRSSWTTIRQANIDSKDWLWTQLFEPWGHMDGDRAHTPKNKCWCSKRVIWLNQRNSPCPEPSCKEPCARRRNSWPTMKQAHYWLRTRFIRAIFMQISWKTMKKLMSNYYTSSRLTVTSFQCHGAVWTATELMKVTNNYEASSSWQWTLVIRAMRTAKELTLSS